MRTHKLLTMSLLLASATFTAACASGKGDSDSASDTDATATVPTTMTMPTTGGTTDEPTGTSVPTTTVPTTTDDPTTNEPTTNDPTTDPTTGGDDPFVFDQTPPDQLVQIDRMGMPAIATAVISADNKNAYNDATPAIDADGTFVPDILANIAGLHAALDDDLAAFGLTPCEAMTSCAAQGAPLVVPDTLKINIDNPPGFPNGRRLADPVIDLTLAVIMLDLSIHDVATLANVPVNPPANDKPFLDNFPYLATPW